VSDLIQTINQSLLELVSKAVEVLPALIVAIAILVITRYSVKPIRRLVHAAAGRMLKSISLQSLLIQIASVATWVFGILLASIILFPDLGLGDLIGFLGLGSVAVGFAFQDIFKNFLAGVLLLINEPFKLNDQIIVDEYEGTVEEINIRSTEIRTYTGERVVIPNATVFTNPVKVLTDRHYRRTDLAIGLDYNTPLPRAVQVLQIAISDVEGVLSNPSIEVDIVEFGESSINFIVRYWTQPQMLHVRQVRTRVIMALKEACDRAEFNIPYPIRTVYHFDQEKYNDHYPVTANGKAQS
jgi:small conductance mechanosensitive channel